MASNSVCQERYEPHQNSPTGWICYCCGKYPTAKEILNNKLLLKVYGKKNLKRWIKSQMAGIR